MCNMCCVNAEESFLFVPCPLSSVTKMMTDSVARNFQLLFDYVCDDDARLAHCFGFTAKLSAMDKFGEC